MARMAVSPVALAALLAAGPAIAEGVPPACAVREPLPVTGPDTDSLSVPGGSAVALADVFSPDGPVPVGPDGEGGALRAHPAGEADRYGRVPAHVERVAPDGSAAWLQADLVRRGLAVVAPDALSTGCAARLLPAEAEARAARRGVWAGTVPSFVANDPAIPQAAGAYGIVTGRIESTGESRRIVFLNFGTVYATDFTVLVHKGDQKRWPEAERSLERLAGRTVRVRGLLEAWNGGMIRVEHPAQIEVLDGDG